MIGMIQPSELPSPPQSTLNILKACSDESADFSDITKLVTNEPQLTVEVLRMVNSAFYSFSHEINSLNQAISVIGVKSLRNLCLCLSVKEVFKETDFDSDFLDQFWTDSIFRAVSARHLAELSNIDPDESFTAGLLQDFGLLILLYLDSDKIPVWSSLRLISPDNRLKKEKSVFGYSHTEIFEYLGKEWGLPVSIVDPIVTHHACGDEGGINICKILNAADWFSYVMASEHVKISSDLCKSYLSQTLQLSTDKIENCLTHISSLVNNAADALGLKINDIPEYNELLKQSNIRLAKDNLDIQELNWTLQETIKERDLLSQELNNELKLATEIQESLLPDDKDLPVLGFNIPAKQLSGDFYDYQEVADGSILFCLADVSGKGVNASLLMVKVSSLFHCLGKFIFDLTKLVHVINNELVETSIRGMFVTFVCGKYYKETGALEIINAGHPPAIIFNGKKNININSRSIPLGIVSDTEFYAEKYSLNDSVLYVFTDGLTEAVNDNKMIGVDGVIGILENVVTLDVKDQLSSVMSTFKSDKIYANDDMTMIIVNGK